MEAPFWLKFDGYCLKEAGIKSQKNRVAAKVHAMEAEVQCGDTKVHLCWPDAEDNSSCRKPHEKTKRVFTGPK